MTEKLVIHHDTNTWELMETLTHLLSKLGVKVEDVSEENGDCLMYDLTKDPDK